MELAESGIYAGLLDRTPPVTTFTRPDYSQGSYTFQVDYLGEHSRPWPDGQEGRPDRNRNHGGAGAGDRIDSFLRGWGERGNIEKMGRIELSARNRKNSPTRYSRIFS
jgi:hypothetical protein